MAKPRYTRAARQDLKDILDHIAANNPTRALSYVEEIRDHCRQIARYPKAAPLREDFGPRVRAAIHGRYLILYSERAGQVVVERIVHGARDLRKVRP